MKEELFDAFEFISVILGLLSLSFCLVYGSAWYECDTYERVTGARTKMGALTCYINEGGQWMAWDEYKYRFATRGSKGAMSE